METTDTTTNAGVSPRLSQVLTIVFCLWVIALAVYQFSENTADPDLWGHTLFGQEFLKSHTLAKTEPYSWTAHGYTWINHEVIAEVALGFAHAQFGGTGILLLKVGVGLLTFFIALWLGGRRLSWPTKAFAWMFGALALVEISFGFAPRPQIFTALALALELWFITRIHEGRWWPAIALPPLFTLWTNTHGGVLAGYGLLGLAAFGSTVQAFKSNTTTVTSRAVLLMWISVVACGAAMLINPWGLGLIKWLIGSVLWLRPEIEEWNPTPLNWDHATLFILVILAAFAWICSRRPKQLWQLLICAAFALLALRSVRNTPLFAIVALATVPEHLADVCQRFRHLVAQGEDSFRHPRILEFLTAFFGVTFAGILAATFVLHKQQPLTIEVPRKQYPVAAVHFIQKHNLKGNLLVFFDWGEMCLWELPDSPISVDGRLDTSYPRDVIKNHWLIYNGQPHDTNVVNLNEADFALLPSNLQGAVALSKQPGWRAAYFDETAVVLVRDVERFPSLNSLVANNRLPVDGEPKASAGRAAFPEKPSERIARTISP